MEAAVNAAHDASSLDVTSALSRRMAQMQEELNAMQRVQGELKNDDAKFLKDVQSLQRELETTTRQLSSAQARKQKLQKELQGVEAEISKLEKQKEETTNKIYSASASAEKKKAEKFRSMAGYSGLQVQETSHCSQPKSVPPQADISFDLLGDPVPASQPRQANPPQSSPPAQSSESQALEQLFSNPACFQQPPPPPPAQMAPALSAPTGQMQYEMGSCAGAGWNMQQGGQQGGAYGSGAGWSMQNGGQQCAAYGSGAGWTMQNGGQQGMAFAVAPCGQPSLGSGTLPSSPWPQSPPAAPVHGTAVWPGTQQGANCGPPQQTMPTAGQQAPKQNNDEFYKLLGMR